MLSLRSLTHFLFVVIIATSIYPMRGRSLAQTGSAISEDKVWTRISVESFKIDTLNLKPRQFAAFTLDSANLGAIVRRAPKEFSAAARARRIVLTLPLPNGQYGRFRVEESPIIEPKLAQRYPTLKSYSARGIDDRTARGRFEITDEGLRAMVIATAGTFYIDRASKSNQRQYISYYKSYLPADPDKFLCRVNNPRPKPIRQRQRQQSPYKERVTLAPTVLIPNVLRIYRIAVAASSEYVSAIHESSGTGPTGDPVAEALFAIHRTVDRVNLIYESELGVRLVLIGDETNLIFVDPATDPYAGPSTLDDLLDMNQLKIDELVGWDSYDVGHLFLTHGGGTASEPCACNDWFKANGVSGRSNPQGDAYDVDYVAHELAHQFGASHSFNGTTGGCMFRNPPTAYEPGSGSTIMGYSSSTQICGSENVQNQSDDYFHAISLQQIRAFITNPDPQMGGCAQKVSTSNLFRPVLSVTAQYTIPQGTPFRLSILGGSDADGDPVTYNWEEFDLGDPDPPNLGDPSEPTKIRPLFRSRKWDTGLSRTFPQLMDLLEKPSAGAYTAESLPTNNRTMRFRATARDGRGRYGFKETRIRIVASTKMRVPDKAGVPVVVSIGPFEVTQPSQHEIWRRGTNHDIRWDVANTTRAPISCKKARIFLLMRDNNNSHFYVATVLNNGFASVRIPPNTPLGRARVKVAAFGNIFFNVAAADVEITR